MKDVVSGTDKSFSDIKKDKGLVVIFSCNTCPFVKKAESVLTEASFYAKRYELGYVLVNSNEAKRADEDSPAAMKKYAVDMKYSFPYLIDNNSAAADAFGAMRTPQAFVFDNTGKLVYKGAIMDEGDPAKAKMFYLKDAIKAVFADKEIAVKEAKSIGCTIKRNTPEVPK